MSRRHTGWTLRSDRSYKAFAWSSSSSTIGPRYRFWGGGAAYQKILNKKRKLTVEMMRSLRKHSAIPAESLLA